MSKVIACPKCKKKLTLQGNPAGKTVQCPACSARFKIGSGASGQTAGSRTSRPVAAARGQAAGQSFGNAIDDPGFGEVDIESIRERLAEKEQESLFENRAADSPYAHLGVQSQAQQHDRSLGELVHRQISFGKVLNKTFTVFTNNLAHCLVNSLIFIAMLAVCLGLLAIPVLLAQSKQIDPTTFLVSLIVLGIIVSNVLVGYFLGTTRMASNLVIKGQAKISDVFSGFIHVGHGFLASNILAICNSGPMGLNILFWSLIGQLAPDPMLRGTAVVILSLHFIAAIGAAVFCTYRFMLYANFIVNQEVDGISSLSLSNQFMQRNTLITIAIMLVVTVLIVVATAATLSLASLLIFPFYCILVSTIYGYATGQIED